MTSDGGRILGRLGAGDGRGTVRIEDTADAEIGRVWAALTEPDRLADWYGVVEGELRLGGEFHCRLHASGWEGTRRVDACEPPRRLVVASTDLEKPQADSTEVTLAGDGQWTVLVVDQRGLPLDLLWAFGAGLQIHVEDLLAYVAGRGRVDVAQRFGELEGPYKDMAATVG